MNQVHIRRYREIGGLNIAALAVRLTFPARDVDLRHWAARVCRIPAESGAKSSSMSTIVWEVRDDDNGSVGSTVVATGSLAFDDYTLPLYQIKQTGFHYTGDTPVILDKTKYYWFILRTDDSDKDKTETLCWYAKTTTTQTQKYYDGSTWHDLTGWYDLDITVLDEQAGAVWDVVIDGNGYMTPGHHKATTVVTAQSGLMATRGGQSAHSQFRYPYSAISQDSFAHGLGQLVFRDADAFKFGVYADTRVAGQVLPGPFTYLTSPSAAQDAKYTPTPDGTTIYALRGLPVQATDANTQYKYFATRFQWPAAGGDVGTTITSLGVWLRKLVASPDSTVHVEIWSHDATNNQPDTMLRSVEFTDYAQEYLIFKGLPVTSLTVTNETYYWLVVKVVYTGSLGKPEYEFLANPHDTALSTTKYSQDGSTWTTYDCDLYYIINPPTNAALASDAAVIGFTEYSGDLYTAAGTKVYKWDGSQWVAESVTLSANATGILDFGGYLFVAVGTNTIHRYNGSTWDTVTGPSGIHVQRLFKALGYMFAIQPSSASTAYQIYKTSDGTTWSAAIDVGTVGAHVVSILPWKDLVYIIRSDGRTYYLDNNDLAIFRFDIGAASDAGDQTTIWSDMLFVPSMSGLLRWSGGLVEIIQPDFEGGIPPKFRGEITAMASTVQALYCVVSPYESGGHFSVLAYNGVGWHPVAKTWRTKAASGRPQQVYATYAQPLDGGIRLWVAEDNMVQYLDIYDNPWETSGVVYAPEGWLTTSWWDGGVHDAQKYFSRIRVVADGIRDDSTAETAIEVYYALDEETNWRFMGHINTSQDTLAFPDDTTGQTIRFMFVLHTNHPDYAPRLRYYSVEAIIRAQPGYVHSVRVLLAYPLTDLKGERHTDRTAQQMYQALRQAAAQDAPIIIATPWETMQAQITNLSVSGGSVQREGPYRVVQWERIATVSFVEV